jgi:hypothetical protein
MNTTIQSNYATTLSLTPRLTCTIYDDDDDDVYLIKLQHGSGL